jgi:B-cell receptor-associated protein 31
MIQLLFLVLFAEGVVALLMMVKVGPLRELAMRVVDQVKTGKGPATVKTLACTLSVILMSNVASILKVQNKGLKLGTVSPMDQVLWRTHLLEASLIGEHSSPSPIPILVFFTDSIVPAAYHWSRVYGTFDDGE